MKKCPPGVICFENITLMFFLVLIVFFVFYMITKSRQPQQQSVTINEYDERGVGGGGVSGWFSNWVPSFPYNNLPGDNSLPKDVLLNPYAAPFRDERYFVPENIVRGGTVDVRGAVPINVSTNIGAVDTTYRQIGIMTPLNGVSKDNILPLMGRPLFTSRDKWQYYTISNQHNNVKLPISFKGKSALNDNGVDKIYNGDTVYVEGYNDAFKTTVYENDTIKYLPFL